MKDDSTVVLTRLGVGILCSLGGCRTGPGVDLRRISKPPTEGGSVGREGRSGGFTNTQKSGGPGRGSDYLSRVVT